MPVITINPPRIIVTVANVIVIQDQTAFADITVNGVDFIEVQGGDSYDIPVRDTDGTNGGSKIGSEWIIPDITINVSVDGVAQTPVSVAAFESSVTVNVTWI
jgi:hypothetical protein